MSRDALSALTNLARYVSREIVSDHEFVNQLLDHLAHEPETSVPDACALLRESAIPILNSRLAEIRDNDYIVVPVTTGNATLEQKLAAAKRNAPNYRCICNAVGAWLHDNANS